MHPLNQALQAGYAALQRGDLTAARQQLKAHKHPKAQHLLALVEKAAGDLPLAARLLEQAAKGDPDDAEIANNLGKLLKTIGRFDDAECAYRRALTLNPGFIAAGSSLGRLLIDLERWQDALNVCESMLDASPGNTNLRYDYGTIILGLGQAEDAFEIFDALIAEGSDQPPVRFMRARCYLELGKIDEAFDDLRASHTAGPTALSLKILAGTLWMTGDREGFEALLESATQDPDLVVTAAELLRQGGDPQKAIDVLDAMRRRQHLPAESWIVSSSAQVDLDEPAAAEAAARACLSEEPGNRIVLGSLISSQLMQGKAQEALDLALEMREREPDGQHWIAYEATALRLLDDDRYDSLVDLERFVRPYQLPVPDGYESIEAFNQAFLGALDRWHRYKTHPLDQSLRDGSQTPRDLTGIDDPVIRDYVKALDGPIRQYMQDVGSGPDHPLTRRHSGDYRITGCWSVQLKGGGWHINHVHPEGWISSAYYVSVPEETQSGDDKSGWIKFGEPPFETEPPTPPQKWIRPEAGLLVLFPSFLWHGTVPIHGDSIRVTAPFDAVPA